MLKKNNLIYIIPLIIIFAIFSRYTILSIFHLEKVVENKPIINNIKEGKDETQKKELYNAYEKIKQNYNEKTNGLLDNKTIVKIVGTSEVYENKQIPK
jgi:hypothetical protein